MSLEYAVLGFLSYRPMSGYDLKKFFDQSVGHFWSATQSHIYKALDALERKNWVAAELIPQQGKPNRREYRLTKKGSAELLSWLKTPLPLDPVREPWLIQVFFAHNLLNEDLVKLFETRAAEIRARIDSYRESQEIIERNGSQPGAQRMRLLWQFTLDYGMSHYQFELGWLEKAAQAVRTLPPLK